MFLEPQGGVEPPATGFVDRCPQVPRQRHSFALARALGSDPRPTGLEPAMLPLHHARLVSGPGGRTRTCISSVTMLGARNPGRYAQAERPFCVIRCKLAGRVAVIGQILQVGANGRTRTGSCTVPRCRATCYTTIALAEEAGFEPASPVRGSRFPGGRVRPLRHSSVVHHLGLAPRSLDYRSSVLLN